MADPLSWGVIVTAAAATTAATAGVIGAVDAYGQKKQAAKTAEDNALLQQKQMEYNRRMEEREAAALEAETQENARRQRLAAAELRSQQMALLGKSGAAMSSGSPLAILGKSAADEELKVQDIHYGGARSSSAHRVKATDYAFGSRIAGANAIAARYSRPSVVSLGATIAGDLADTSYKYFKK